MKKKSYFWLVAIIVLIIVPLGYYFYNQSAPSKLDTFAQCLGDKGVTFFGAFWCPHCQEQKKIFGSAEKELPYVECSTPDGKGQTQECIDAEINTYPTWEFADGERLVGTQSLETLSEKSTCELPAE